MTAPVDLRPDDEIELEAIVADARAGALPVATVVDELREETAATGEDRDERRVRVLRRALAELGGAS